MKKVILPLTQTLLAAALLTLSSSLWAQQNKLASSCFFGFVEDPGRNRVPAATIVFGSVAWPGTVATYTDAKGQFCISQMPSAPYWIVASAEGLRTPEKLKLQVGLGFRVPLLLRLERSSLQTAKADLSLISRGEAAIGKCLCRDLLEDLGQAQVLRPENLQDTNPAPTSTPPGL